MFFYIIFIALVIFFVSFLFYVYLKEAEQAEAKRNELKVRIKSLSGQERQLAKKIEDLNKDISQLFAFYDTARLISPLFNKDELFSGFFAKLNSLEGIEASGLKKIKGPNCHRFSIGKGKRYLYVQTESHRIVRLLPVFAKLLSICRERLSLYRRLQELSIHDYLTGIYNRRYFTQRKEEEFFRSKKLKHNLSFLMLDIDNFKKVNDTYGHFVGDAVLKKSTELISESIRQIDFIGRLGGEEFGVLLLDTDKAGAIMVSERICSKISQEKINVFDESLSITVSIGIATYPVNTIYLDLLAEIADKALYQAKSSGKNRVCWF